MRKLLTSLLILTASAMAAPSVNLPVYHPHGEALRMMFFDTHTRGGGAAIFASGGVTANVLCKSNGSGQCTDSSITDNGTNVISPEAILGSVGSSTLPGYAFTGGATQNASGMWWASGSVGIIGTNGTTGWLTIGANNGPIQTGTSQCFGWSSTSTAFGNNNSTSLCQASAGVMNVASGVSGSGGTVSLASVQYRGLAQTTFVTSDFTTSGVGTALEAITGLTWTFPATTAINARIDCNILYLQNVANVAVAFGFQDATVAPTNLAASGIQYTSATASTEGTLASSATTTQTAVTSATPSAITTIWHAQLHFLIEQPSNASTSVFTIRTSTATAGDTVTVKRGSYCSLAQ